MSKRALLYILLLFAAMFPVAAQSVPAEGLMEEVMYAGNEVQVDSTLLGKDIFSVLPENVIVLQDAAVRNALIERTEAGAEHTVNGFRIRISRSARESSLSVLRRFNAQYPYMSVYRSYSAPNFKVTVGNFRNRAEAEAVHRIIKSDYPDAFIVRDRFRYPTIGRSDMNSIIEGEE